MLRKARKVIPQEACIILYMYDAMILPLFDYCCAVWGGCGKTNRDYLDKLQRHAASIIEGCKVEHQDISATFSWPSLENCRKYHTCLQIFNCLHQLAPACLLHNFSYSSDFHTYNTCHKEQLRLPLARTKKYQTSFQYNGAKVWNTLLKHIRQITSLPRFKQALKSHFCNQYLV